jgi:hypothetical protein
MMERTQAPEDTEAAPETELDVFAREFGGSFSEAIRELKDAVPHAAEFFDNVSKLSQSWIAQKAQLARLQEYVTKQYHQLLEVPRLFGPEPVELSDRIEKWGMLLTQLIQQFTILSSDLPVESAKYHYAQLQRIHIAVVILGEQVTENLPATVRTLLIELDERRARDRGESLVKCDPETARRSRAFRAVLKLSLVELARRIGEGCTVVEASRLERGFPVRPELVTSLTEVVRDFGGTEELDESIGLQQSAKPEESTWS